MALSISQVEDKLTNFFDGLKATIANEVANKGLPLIDKISALPGAADSLDPFGLLENQLLDAINATDAGGPPPDPVAAIVGAINGLGLSGITASQSSAGGLEISLATDRTITTGTATLDIGKAVGGFLDLDVATSATFKAALAATLFIAADGSLSLKDTGTPELTVAVDAALSLTDLNANLGIAKVRISDADPAKPELSADFNIDLSLDASGASATTTLTAQAGLDLSFATSDVLAGVLPDIGGRIVLDIPVSGSTFGTPTVALKDITLDLSSYLDIFGDTLGEVGDVFNNGALGTIVDIALEPVPGLNSLVRKFPFLLNRFDKVGGITGGGDGTVTLGDLAVFGNNDLKEPLTRFYQGLAIVDELRKLNLGGGGGGGLINIGDATISGGVGTPVFDKDAIIAAVKSAFGDLGGLSDLAQGFLENFDIEGLPKPDEKPGLTFELLENPARILDILLGTAPVKLIEYNVPALEVKASAGGFFNVLGPLGFELSGNINGVIDLDVGYDTFGVATGDFAKGFYFTTQPLPPSKPGRYPYEPVGELDTDINGGAGVGFAGSSITVGGTIGFNVDAYFREALFRPLAEDFGCAFDVSGRATAEIGVKIQIGFGPFKVKKKIPLVSTVLADFEAFTCPPATVQLPPETPGLATISGTEAVLNVGSRSPLRQIPDNAGGTPRLLFDPDAPDDEGYVIGLARNREGKAANPAGDPPAVVVPGLDVFAFGVTQRVAPPTLIKADFGAGNDTLIVQSDVSVAVVASGGAGEDALTGGAGNDVLSGDGEDDNLTGADGNDLLQGGDGDDFLDGGKGTDTLQGGAGIDTVTYAEANRDVRVGVFVTLGDAAFTGSGGEADGDRFDSIEVVTGTDFDDYIRATGASFAVVLEGGKGADVLIGGKADDLLFGSQDGDTINGQEGFDGTTYITSWGQVDVDLQRSIQFGADAQGDRLFNLEAIQGTLYADVIRGNGADNRLDGADGNDFLEGRGGADTVSGSAGNDLVLGGYDGDLLDGGDGYDTLSYQNVAGPVTVDLGNGTTGPGASGRSDQVLLAVANVNGSGRGYSSFEALTGSEAGDSLTGDLGDNRIEGRGGADLINGDAGNDVLDGGEGGDILIGGTGIDWVVYDRSGSAVTVDLLGIGSGGTAQGDSYGAVENILGSSFADRLLGNDADNLIDPNISRFPGEEVVDGRGGTDILRVNYASFGADVGNGISGGFGLFSSTGGLIARQTGGIDWVAFTDVERLFVAGTSKADTLYGGQSLLGDRFYTGGGDDVVVSGIGADDVRTGNGDDEVVYGTTAGRQPSFSTPPTVFNLEGGEGFDTLAITLTGLTTSVVVGGGSGLNIGMANGASAKGFEYLREVRTGSGNDLILQSGDFNNTFDAGNGSDYISSGLGFDEINGGADYLGGLGFGDGNNIYLTGEQSFFQSAGDVLVLDYSTLGPETSVLGNTNTVTTGLKLQRLVFINEVSQGFRYTDIKTNVGGYSAFDLDSLEEQAIESTSFQNIERLQVTGSSGNDVLTGTFVPVDSNLNWLGFSTARGDDILFGGAGNDLIFGYSGDDILDGGAGDDILVGNSIQQFGNNISPVDYDSIDALTGGSGADRFVIGSSSGSAYFTPFFNIPSTPNHARITDFNPNEGDVIQLTGQASNYFLSVSGGSTFIFANRTIAGVDSDLVAVVSNVTGLDLNASYFRYGGDIGTPAPLAVPAPLTVAAPNALEAPLARSAATVFAAAADDWVTQTDDPAALKAILDGASGGSGSSLTVEGSAEAVGTFDGDPFGLGKGLILSTGRVEDLPGSNTVSTAGTNITSIPIVFEKIGRAGGSDIFRADLSNLGIDLKSLTIADGNTKIGGAGGTASGFDLDAIALSRIFLPSVTSGTNLNLFSTLQPLSAFDFSNASITFRPGTQRPPTISAFPYGESLDGAANGVLVDNSQSTLGRFAFGPDAGSLTLGDGGSISFDLTGPVKTEGPLYLYIGEEGATGETVVGSINVSPDNVEPTGDLSTDLGTPGTEDDITRLTYSFTPKAGDSRFALDVVLFSEELPEFDGTRLTDLFSIQLNGIEIGALSNDAALTIKNLVYSDAGDLIDNSPGTGPLADRIRADAYTRTLTIGGALQQGVENVLSIEVKDDRDGFLDSGLLIKDGSFRTFAAPTVTVTTAGDGTIVAGGNPVALTVAIDPPTTSVTAPVTVTIDPSANLDLGLGLGAPVTVTFQPGDSTRSRTLAIQAPAGADPDLDGIITYNVTSGDPAFNGQPIAPDALDIVAPSNRPPAIATLPDLIRVAENTSAVAIVQAVDPDPGQTLAYSISGGADAALFSVDPISGALAFRNAPDFEKPADQGKDNRYDVIVRATDNGDPALFDEQAYRVQVTDVAETTRLAVEFRSESATLRNSFGWYDATTGKGGLLFGSMETTGTAANIKPGTVRSFSVATADVANIQYFLVPGGGGIRPTTAASPNQPVRVIQRRDGSWGVALIRSDGTLAIGSDGQPTVLGGVGARALFSETGKNAGGVDYASATTGPGQTPATLSGDTADGPTGQLAWEDSAAGQLSGGGYGVPGDADYNDAVFSVRAFAGATLAGNDTDDDLQGGGGNDVLSGLGGRDTLRGGDGADRLEGGPGDDLLIGGAGADRFVFEAGFGRDRITDFKVSGDGADKLAIASNLLAPFTGVPAFLASSLVSQSGSHTILRIDPANSITLENVSLASLRANPGAIVLV